VRYPELVTAAHRPYWVNDFVQYDGRDPKLRRTYLQLLNSGRLAGIITSATPPGSGYTLVRTCLPEPSGVYAVRLYVRRGLIEAMHGTRC